jgi:hypothetical protein
MICLMEHLLYPDDVFAWCLEQATVTYYLLLDSQRSQNLDDYLLSDFEELVSSRFSIDRE